MTKVDDRSRIVRGLPGGGRFAAEQKQEPGLELGGAAACEGHGNAVNGAASETGIRSGHAYEYQSTAMLLDPQGRAEAIINLDDGEPTRLRHNYATGATTYSAPFRGISESGDADLIQVAVDDICRTHEGDTAGMFARLRQECLAADGLHPTVRAALSSLS